MLTYIVCFIHLSCISPSYSFQEGFNFTFNFGRIRMYVYTYTHMTVLRIVYVKVIWVWCSNIISGQNYVLAINHLDTLPSSSCFSSLWASFTRPIMWATLDNLANWFRNVFTYTKKDGRKSGNFVFLRNCLILGEYAKTFF